MNATGQGRKMGRPPYEPTPRDREQVKTMTAMGIPDYDIAPVIGITPPTLRKYFRQELKVGHIQATAQVAQSLYLQAVGRPGNVALGIEAIKPVPACAIFWMKCRGGWREDGEYVGKKQEKNEAAKKAAKGKFAPAEPPKLVVNNR